MICGTYDRDLAGWFLSTPPSILHSFFSHNEVVRKALGGCSVLGQLWLHNINLKAKVNLKKHWHIHSRCSYSFDSRPTTAALKTHQEIMHFWWKARSSQPLLYSVSKVILGNCQAEEDEANCQQQKEMKCFITRCSNHNNRPNLMDLMSVYQSVFSFIFLAWVLGSYTDATCFGYLPATDFSFFVFVLATLTQVKSEMSPISMS